MSDDPVKQLADTLNGDEALKLWSVLVTCLGDISREQSADVSGVFLSTLVERIGLQPQAMRVALHRLKRDGWVDSRREGRVGYHRLSPQGLRQTRRAVPRIYGSSEAPATCQLVGFLPDDPDALTLLPDGVSAIAISRQFALITGKAELLPPDWLLAQPTDRPLPPWVMKTLRSAACEAEFQMLEQRLDAVHVPDKILDRYALRLLVLHVWRRMILRSNPAAEIALGAARAEISCRKRVQRVLAELGPMDPDGLGP